MKILISARSSDGLLASVREIAPAAEILTLAEVEARPGLLEEIEVAYGGFPRDEWRRARQLRWLQTQGAGVNSLIGPEVREHPVVITNASGIHAEPITEHMFGMLLMHTRRLAESWDLQRGRTWDSQRPSQELAMLLGQTLGILGVGAIGGCSARVGRAFGMRVIGLRRSREPCDGVERMYCPEERLEFFAESDVVMNVLPLTERTRHFIGPAEFAALKEGAVVANAGRGPTIDTDALVAALRSGRVGAALLDVTDPEPLPPDHPLWSMENVYITPHYGGSHPGYADRAGCIFLENLRRYLRGEPLINVVDKAEGY